MDTQKLLTDSDRLKRMFYGDEQIKFNKDLPQILAGGIAKLREYYDNRTTKQSAAAT